MLQTGIALILSLMLFSGSGWADACPEKCRNASFLGTNFWTAVRNPTNTITVSRNGLSVSPQPGGTTPNLPAVQGFGSQVFLVVRGTDINQGVWANQWTGSSWTGWYNVNAGMTTNSPAMEVFNNTLFLVVSGVDINKGLWVNRWTTTWVGWSGVASQFTSAQTCASGSNIRVGGTRTDGQCWRLTSTTGTTWSGPMVGSPCP
jgi:hypothetical protein